MALTGTGILLVGALLVIGSAVATVALWQPARRLGWLCWPLRGGMVLSGQLVAVLAAGLVVNHVYVFYASWSELFGARPAVDSRAAAPGLLDQRLAGQLRDRLPQWKRGGGTGPDPGNAE